MFSYRIGQAQTLAGARITSTNTDGLFSVLEATLNNQVLEEESKEINVEIEPELTYLISKDSNNRIEVDHATGKIQRASGGSLACHKGPTPDKSLAHPAIIDWALCEYLVYNAMRPGGDLSLPFDEDIGRNIFKAAPKAFDKTMLLNMYQNVIASSLGTDAYNFAVKPGRPDSPIPLQHYNRVFIMKDKTPGTMHLYCAAARKITPATAAKRAKNGERAQQHDRTAISILTANGLLPGEIDSSKEAVVKKITGIEPAWFMYIMNGALDQLTDAEKDDILGNLDYEKYLGLLKSAYENNWRNKLPTADTEDDTETNDDETVSVTDTDAVDAAEPASTETDESLITPPIYDDDIYFPDTASDTERTRKEAEALIAARQNKAAAPIPEELLSSTPEPVVTPEPVSQKPEQPATTEPEQNTVSPTQTSATTPTVKTSLMPPPEVMQWLQTVSPWDNESPFPVTELDSNNYDELMQNGLQLILRGCACITKAQEIGR